MPRVDRRDLAIVAFLALLAMFYYYPLVIMGRVIADFDPLAFFYPHAIELATQIRAGQVPLWDPLEFAGVPFLANSQIGALYPPSLLYLLGPVSRVYAILIVSHVWLLAVGCYILGRVSLGLSRPGATFSAVAIAYSGFVGGMVGHLNQVEALAWTPLAIVLVERACARASWRYALLAALPFAACLLAGHSQVLYFTGLLSGFAGGGRIVQEWHERWIASRAPGVSRQSRAGTEGPGPVGGSPWLPVVGGDVARLSVGPLLGALLGAAQLVPTLELTRVSIRSTGLSFADASAFSLPPPYLLAALLPTVGQTLPSSEWLGYLGLVTLVLAVFGLFLRPRAEAYALAGLALIGLLLALGHFTPLYEPVFRYVPGVRLFRVPARWLTLWIFAVGLLGGWGLDAAVSPRAKMPRWRLRGVAPFGVPAAMLVVIVAREMVRYRQIISWPTTTTFALWVITALLTGVILLARRRWRNRVTSLAAIGVLVVELGVANQGLPVQNAVPIRGVEVLRASDQFLISQNSPDRVMALGDNTYDPGDLSALRASVKGTLTPNGENEFIAAIKHAEGLTPNLFERFGLASIDGYDGGILPLARYDDLKKLFPVQGSDPSDGRLRLQLVSAPDANLLGWLNVRYLLMDRLRDQWIDGVYYDLAVTADLQPDSSVTLSTNPPFTFDRLGVVLAGSPSGPPRGVLTLHAGQTTLRLDLLDPKIRQAGRFIKDDFDPNGAWLWLLNAPTPDTLSQVTANWSGSQPTALRSLSAINTRLSVDRTITTSRAYQVQFLGDMKIYVNRDVLPRAFLARGVDLVPTLETAVDRMRQSGWDPRTSAIAISSDVPTDLAFSESGDAGATRVVDEGTQRVVVDTQASGRRVLVLTDSYYPGWHATIDGKSAPIYEVDLMFRGVIVPPGSHRVVFEYQPISWRVGLIASALGAVVLAVGLWLTVRFPRRQAD